MAEMMAMKRRVRPSPFLLLWYFADIRSSSTSDASISRSSSDFVIIMGAISIDMASSSSP